MPCMDDAQSLPELLHTAAGWDGSISHIDQPSLFHLPPSCRARRRGEDGPSPSSIN